MTVISKFLHKDKELLVFVKLRKIEYLCMASGRRLRLIMSRRKPWGDSVRLESGKGWAVVTAALGSRSCKTTRTTLALQPPTQLQGGFWGQRSPRSFSRTAISHQIKSCEKLRRGPLGGQPLLTLLRHCRAKKMLLRYQTTRTSNKLGEHAGSCHQTEFLTRNLKWRTRILWMRKK